MNIFKRKTKHFKLKLVQENKPDGEKSWWIYVNGSLMKTCQTESEAKETYRRYLEELKKNKNFVEKQTIREAII